MAGELVSPFKEPGHGCRSLPNRIKNVKKPEKDTGFGAHKDVKDKERRETECNTDGRGAILDQKAAADQGEGRCRRKAEEKDRDKREYDCQQDAPAECACKLLQEL